jgi:hypothetical protein
MKFIVFLRNVKDFLKRDVFDFAHIRKITGQSGVVQLWSIYPQI